MLEHPDAGDLVVEHAIGQVDVVEQLHAHATLEPPRGDLALDVLELVLRQRDAGRVHAVVLRRPEHEPAPAAADVEEGFARREAQLAADVVELARLRVGERVGVAPEVGARVHHPRVEPQPVESVGDVVVMLDVRLVAA